MPIYTYLLTAILSGLLAFGGGWKVQQWRFDSKEKQRVEQALADQRELARADRLRVTNVVDAQNSARLRESGLRADAGAARAAVDGLRESAERTVQDARASAAACAIRATALRDVLTQCGAAYQDMGERADRHVNDVKTLIEAWPK